jgi:hypothetical protein
MVQTYIDKINQAFSDEDYQLVYELLQIIKQEQPNNTWLKSYQDIWVANYLLNKINETFSEEDYILIPKLLQQLGEEQPENPWLGFYQARLEETKENLDLAEEIYKKVLFNTINRQVLSQTRKRLENLVNLKKNKVQEKLQQALQKVKQEQQNQETGLLILKPIEAELKKNLAQKLAQIMNIDPFTAQLQLPTKNWRLYKVGDLAELLSYRNTLLDEDIPCFSVKLKELEKIKVYQVKYLQFINDSELSIVCQQDNAEETISFQWQEVSSRVEALLPIFESSLEINNKRQLYRKTKTLDYAQIIDLHLKSQNTIIRLTDYQYKFNQGIEIPKQNKGQTNRENWNNLQQFLQPYLVNTPVVSEFHAFAEKALDFSEMLKEIKPKINLFRREESLWDAAFELYTGLILLQSQIGLTQ